jgi:hypothetical protein
MLADVFYVSLRRTFPQPEKSQYSPGGHPGMPRRAIVAIVARSALSGSGHNVAEKLRKGPLQFEPLAFA